MVSLPTKISYGGGAYGSASKSASFGTPVKNVGTSSSTSIHKQLEQLSRNMQTLANTSRSIANNLTKQIGGGQLSPEQTKTIIKSLTDRYVASFTPQAQVAIKGGKELEDQLRLPPGTITEPVRQAALQFANTTLTYAKNQAQSITIPYNAKTGENTMTTYAGKVTAEVTMPWIYGYETKTLKLPTGETVQQKVTKPAEASALVGKTTTRTNIDAALEPVIKDFDKYLENLMATGKIKTEGGAPLQLSSMRGKYELTPLGGGARSAVNVPLTTERFALTTKEIPSVTAKIGTKTFEKTFDIYQTVPRPPEGPTVSPPPPFPINTQTSSGGSGRSRSDESSSYVTSDPRAKDVPGSHELPGGQTWKVTEKYARQVGFKPENKL